MENIKILINAIKETQNANKVLRCEIEKQTEKIHAVIDQVRSNHKHFNVKASEDQKNSITEMEATKAFTSHLIDFNNLYIKALAQEALKEYEVIICKKLLANKEKLENVPVRYKKVTNMFNCSEDTECRCWYSSYYGNIELTFAGNVLPYEKRNLYITKNHQEYILDFEQIQKRIEHQNKTPEEIKEAVNNYVNAKKEIEAINKEAAEKISAIKANNYVLGLSY